MSDCHLIPTWMKVNFPENPENYRQGSWGPHKAPQVGPGQSPGGGPEKYEI